MAKRLREITRLIRRHGFISPVCSHDGLGSSAYGPEAALTILIPLGAEGLHLIQPIMAAILMLLALLYFSYRQTIEAYPNNGGSYIVAKDNLGANAGLLAASALMIDYVLNVAVGISAGIGALTSAVPQEPLVPPACGTVGSACMPCRSPKAPVCDPGPGVRIPFAPVASHVRT
jgi:amino acid transporter